MRIRTRWTLACAALAVSVSAAGAAAQEQPPERDRARMEQRFRAQMARVIKERLELTDEQSEALSAIAEGFESRRRQLFREEQATRRRTEALLLEGAADEAEASELLEHVAELRRRELALFQEEQAALLEILPATKVLQLQALREEMGRRIREMRGRDGRRRGPGDSPGRGTSGDWGGSRPGPAAHPEWPGNVDGLAGVPLLGIPLG